MKFDSVHINTILRNLVFPLFLSASMQSPLLADTMWGGVFNEYMENANAGNVDAQYELGVMYLKGQGVSQDREQALQWLQKASDGGNRRAKGKLLRVKKQQDKFKQCVVKAQSGKTEAQYQVAMMYLMGKGVKRDNNQARKWLGAAARDDYAKAITRLGIINYKGEGGPKNYTEALALFNRVADTSVLAQYYLGEMYATGSGVKKSYLAAIDWYKKSAAGGFDRSEGKIINIEEEIRVQKLRRNKDAKKKIALAKAVRSAPVKKKLVVKQKPIAKEKQVLEPQPVAKQRSVAEQVKKSPLDELAERQWVRGKKPLEYLPSKLTQCDEEKGSLVCLSKMLTREQGVQTIRYRVKSFIKSENDMFVIVYRNLVLDVEVSQEARDQEVMGYDGEVEQGFKVKTGWTREHSVNCKQSSRKQLECVKDKKHKMLLVSDAG